MPFYERGPVRIHYEKVGSGFPLLLIPGGGLNSALSSWQTASPFNAMERYQDDFRCICADLRNANPGQSSGPLDIDRPWDAYTDDQLGLMDHLGIREFMVMGFCIGGPMIHNLIRRAPERVVAAAVTIYPWKDSQEHIDEVVEHARRFLKAHEPVTAGRQRTSLAWTLRRPSTFARPVTWMTRSPISGAGAIRRSSMCF